MNKACMGFFLLFLSLETLAQEMTCLDKLLPFNRYSGVHLVTRDEWNDGKDNLDSEGAEKAITFLTNSKLMCRTNEIVIKISPVCALTIADIPQSNTCFAFTNLGYFIISRDVAKNLSFIFSKDKRFSE